MRAVGDIIVREGHPDLLLFQEVTQNMVLLFRQSAWFRQYHCSPVPEQPYFTLLLARRDTVTLPAMSPWNEKPFPVTQMGHRYKGSRLDRVLCRLSVPAPPEAAGASASASGAGPGSGGLLGWRLGEMRLVGTQALPGLTYQYRGKTLPVLPSDHFGLLVKLQPFGTTPGAPGTGRVLGGAPAAQPAAASVPGPPTETDSPPLGSAAAGRTGPALLAECGRTAVAAAGAGQSAAGAGAGLACTSLRNRQQQLSAAAQRQQVQQVDLSVDDDDVIVL
ncbi:hypothetical protein GPECTOR_39g481 [Gonium pectorale]|uniref:Endonuclease/exonuclease/phosphatase domain-containing protein n=1 Tax=Gonium pectorale TaxID=33097 RepID=A0A150GAW6_GONPE|nr:hypothetical protein GPECTOR_39g481 [Gonium pectorale]|eukprot:KXZ46987.1 hypothetical protein GPECTOR_39g481 [Gonium pectorale]